MRRPFAQVDVFTTTPYLGNPVAVILDAQGVTDDELQRIQVAVGGPQPPQRREVVDQHGVVAAVPAGEPEAFEVRAFSSERDRLVEDPVTGSLNASLAQWLLATGRAQAPYVARQGLAVGRRARACLHRHRRRRLGGRRLRHLRRGQHRAARLTLRATATAPASRATAAGWAGADRRARRPARARSRR